MDSSSELIYFYELQNIIQGNYDNEGVPLFKFSIMFNLIIRLCKKKSLLVKQLIYNNIIVTKMVI